MDYFYVSTPEEEKFRREVSDFLDQELTEEIRQQNTLGAGLGAEGREFSLKLGKKGWLGLGWPEEYGGSPGTISHEIILAQEFARHEAFIPNCVARLMAGPTILRHGSEAMKKEFLPRIASGEIEFSLGYTEPAAGSDLASLQMQAVRDSDHYVISGQKLFNSQSHYADYHWLAARTDRTKPRHKAISLFVVDQRAPGITIHPIQTLGGERTNTVFYDEVRVHESRLVGEENNGFYYLMEALESERLMLSQCIRLRPPLQRLIEYTRSEMRNGRPLAADPHVRQQLAQMAIELEAALSLEARAVEKLKNHGKLEYEASIAKLFASEFRQRLANTGLDILGQWGRLEKKSKWAPLNGEFAHMARSSVVETIGGGTSEVLRNMLAIRALNLPRSQA